MKKTISMLALICAIGATAQEATSSDAKGFSKGDVVLTGNIGFSQDKVDDDKTSTFSVMPSAAIFLSDNISLGLNVGFSSTKEDPADITRTRFTVGPAVRYYFMPKSDFSVYLNLGAGFISEKYEDPTGDAKSTGFGAAFNPGVSYFVSPHFALQASIGALSFDTMKDDDTDVKTDNFNIGLDLTNINFGLLYKF